MKKAWSNWSPPRTPGCRPKNSIASPAIGSRTRAIRNSSGPTPKWSISRCSKLLAYLRANGFKTYIVSGGGVDFMRPWTEKVYGIPPEQVVGSTGKLKYEMRDGKPVLMKLAEIDHVDDGPGKPVGIQKIIGRRPVAAFGNSDGDQQMLQYTAAGNGARFMLIVHHTDAEREWAYDRKSHIGKLDKALDEANAKGWTVVDMKKRLAACVPVREVKGRVGKENRRWKRWSGTENAGGGKSSTCSRFEGDR